MSAIGFYVYNKRCLILAQEYSDMLSLSDGISISYGWLSTVENMLLMLSVSISNDSRSKLKFLKIKTKFATARFNCSALEGMNEVDRAKAIKIVKYYESLATSKCEVCGAPGIEVQVNGWFSRKCSEHIYE